MGVVIQVKKFSANNKSGLLKPIIFCCQYKLAMESAISINKQLAEKLLTIKSEYRTLQIEKLFADIISRQPNDCVIKDFDVMFNPAYKIDVLMILVNTCKFKPFSVIWPGHLDGDNLIYAEEGYQDYRAYDINNYDITCVI